MTDAKPRRTPKKTTAAATIAEPVVGSTASVGEPAAATVASDATPVKAPAARTKANPATTGSAAAAPAAPKPATRRKAAPAAAGPEEAGPAVGSAPAAPKPAARPKVPAAVTAEQAAAASPATATPAAERPATRRKPVAAGEQADAPAPAPGSTGRRPGLPLREPGQARKRPTKKATDIGDGSIDPGEPDAFALAMARRIVDVAEDKKASDILLLDVRALTAVTDYFIICSGMSERQLGAIADGIAEVLKAELHVLPLGREGGANAHWVLLDLGAAIVHVMATPEREFYQLEKLWADAKVLLHVL